MGPCTARGRRSCSLHGAIGDGDLHGHALLDHLTGWFTCHLPSMRGRGLSDDHPELSIGRLVDDVLTYVDSIGAPTGLMRPDRVGADSHGRPHRRGSTDGHDRRQTGHALRLRIIDRQGQALLAGEVGEVVVRGPNLMREYWRNPQASDEAFVDGWCRTGDAGFVDEEGFLHVVDRLKDIIIVGSSNVYPRDLEEVLAGCGDIREAAVVGRAEPLGEVPVAFVVVETRRSMGRDEVLALFSGAIASYKHPRDIVFVDALPRTALGEVQKSVLREWAAAVGTAPVAPGDPSVDRLTPVTISSEEPGNAS